MNSPTETYLEYIQKYCPTLEPKIVSQITSGLEKTNWDEPTLATDFNNIAVIALIEAENCQDLSLRSLYLEMANEALGSGLTLENHPLCAAHLSLLMSVTGQLQQAVELAWSVWIATVASLDNKLDKKEQSCIIYLPHNKNNLGNLAQFFETNFNESKLYSQYLMMLSQALCYSSLCFYNSTGIRWLRVAVQGFPDSVELNFKLGVAYITSNQWEGLFFLDRAKELAPTEAKILQALYLAYRDLGNLQLANHWLNLATQLQPPSVHDPDWQWTTLAMDSPFTYVRFESNLLMAVEASFRSLVTSVLVAEGDWFEKEMEFWRNWIKPGMTVIDVGANVGVYTFSAAQRVGSQGKVLAVEPFSGCVRCLEETCRINQFSWVKICAGAASDRVGSARLSLSTSSELNELVANDASVSMESGAFEEVACFTLDSLREQEHLQQVDILKIDAEGHELAVLMGSQRILSEFAPIILYENIAGSQGSNLPVANYLIDQGYNLFRYQPYLQDLIPLANLNTLQGNLNIVSLPKSKIKETYF
jgi:FkbM family methyltransferase